MNITIRIIHFKTMFMHYQHHITQCIYIITITLIAKTKLSITTKVFKSILLVPAPNIKSLNWHFFKSKFVIINLSNIDLTMLQVLKSN